MAEKIWHPTDRQVRGSSSDTNFYVFRVTQTDTADPKDFLLCREEKVYSYSINMDTSIVSVSEIADITTNDANAEYVSRIVRSSKPGDNYNSGDPRLYLMCCKSDTKSGTDVEILSSIQYIDPSNLSSGIGGTISTPAPQGTDTDCWINAKAIQKGLYDDSGTYHNRLLCAGGYIDNASDVYYEKFYYDLTDQSWTHQEQADTLVNANHFLPIDCLITHKDSSNNFSVWFYGYGGVGAAGDICFWEWTTSSLNKHYTNEISSEGTSVFDTTLGSREGAFTPDGTYGAYINSGEWAIVRNSSVLANGTWSGSDKLYNIDFWGTAFRENSNSVIENAVYLNIAGGGSSTTLDVELVHNNLSSWQDHTYCSNIVIWNEDTGTDNQAIFRCKRDGTSNETRFLMTTTQVPQTIAKADFSGMNTREALNELATTYNCNWKRSSFDTARFLNKTRYNDTYTLDYDLYLPQWKTNKNPVYQSVRLKNTYNDNDFEAVYGNTDSRNEIEVETRFINSVIAGILQDYYLNYYNTIRRVFEVEAYFLIELELFDKVTLKLYDVNGNLEESVGCLLTERSYDHSNKITKLKLIELDATSYSIETGVIRVGGNYVG